MQVAPDLAGLEQGRRLAGERSLAQLRRAPREPERPVHGVFIEPRGNRLEGRDGYASLEVSPDLANDTRGTVEEARRLWAAVDRPNLMIKVPGTKAGVPAIRPH